MKLLKNYFPATLCIILLVVTSCYGQQSEYHIVVMPETLSMQVDDTTQLTGTLQDAEGTTVRDSVFFYSRNRKSVTVSRDGFVRALQPGTFELQAFAVTPNDERISKTIPVEVIYPPITEISFYDVPEKVYTDTKIPVSFAAGLPLSRSKVLAVNPARWM